jgi:flavin-binding protein dodecin
MSNKPPLISHRRIDHLKARAFDCGFTNEHAKQFGKLSKTATWFALLEAYGISSQSVDSVDSVDNALDTDLDSVDNLELVGVDSVDSVDNALDTDLDSVDNLELVGVDTVDTLDWTNDGSFPVCGFTRQNSSFLDWVDFGQFIALALASAGVFVLAMSMWRQINPLNLFPPVRINIQIGQK